MVRNHGSFMKRTKYPLRTARHIFIATAYRVLPC